ncbi:MULTISPECIES: carbohydrate ABC transporter permease [Lacrimispora]|jgi:raffinose/stachyose/melibiose transport system permease protein|uniref:ABC transporter permease n=1 Tax=Lacrimispora celerecrescens TaxID=29354 RepID=A0A084JQZ0_9FIRM|nr:MULTISPECIES: carbohydrate ABC transporter permease [Lacrimispora]KEZ91374.1 ABC transporter permease [Lacrimispora celerecrescens]CUX21649.1 Inner membrane ABC transporter permease protein YcjP [Clostridium sp. C105KSO15]HCD45803.1 carbohydrate ABC transporter permease [Lachnoclostridium sp.]
MKKGFKSIAIKLVIICLVVIEVYPLFWMLTASLKQQSEWTSKPAYALNSGFYIQNYIEAWTRGNMDIFFKNSFICTVVSLFFIVLFTVTVSFAVTKMRWKLKGFVGKYFEFGIMIPVATALIPLFQIYSGMGLLNSRLCLIITYTAFGLSLSTLLTTGYLRSFPDEIMEAAVIDGCGIYKLMWYVVVPLMKNAIVTVLVLQFFFKWNDLIFSMTFISDQKLKTVQTGLLYFQNEFGAKNWGAIFASVSMCVIPMLILYMILNKRVIEGMTAGAVKG